MDGLPPLPDLSKMTHPQKDALIQSLYAMVGDLRSQVQSLKDEVNDLKAQVVELKAMLAKNSRNSSKPPSSDGYGKPNPKSLRQKSQRRTGGQPGHKGSTLSQTDKPDRIETCRLNVCPNCGWSLENTPVHDHQCRQVFDLPKVNVVVTEYQSQVKICPGCDQTVKASFPQGVNSAVQYGVGVKTMATYLSQYQLLPLARMQELFSDIFGLAISQGTLYRILSEGYNHLDRFETSIKEVLKTSPVVHFDETGSRVKSQLHWLHVACTQWFTHYAIHPQRGHQAMADIGILNQFQGNGIHDHWHSYYQFNFSHGLCNAHHLRELTHAWESHGQPWALKMFEYLLTLYDEVTVLKQAGQSELEAKRLIYYQRRYSRILREGKNDLPVLPVPLHPRRGRRKQHKVKNLYDRLVNHKYEVLAFAYNFDAPFDNNLAERDIRMTKVKEKISGCFRSKHGADIFCRIRSYISTAKKQSRNVINALHDAFNAKPFMPIRPE